VGITAPHIETILEKDIISKGEMGRAYSTHESEEKFVEISGRKSRRTTWPYMGG
jgi:hypothetical protein